MSKYTDSSRHPVKSDYADLLNGLVDMQECATYAYRRITLIQIEEVIVSLEEFKRTATERISQLEEKERTDGELIKELRGQIKSLHVRADMINEKVTSDIRSKEFEIEHLRKALVHVAFGLRSTEKHMLCEGVTLIGNNHVKVCVDGVTVDTGPVTLTKSKESTDKELLIDKYVRNVSKNPEFLTKWPKLLGRALKRVKDYRPDTVYVVCDLCKGEGVMYDVIKEAHGKNVYVKSTPIPCPECDCTGLVPCTGS